MKPASLLTDPIHLGLGATATQQPAFTGMDWYAAYTQRTAADGVEGRLVSMHAFSESWDSWEMHPSGAEVVICISGAITLHQEMADGSKASVALEPGDYAINPPGAWHTADVRGEATALFITAGMGTEHKMRQA
jgi:mannose-6-phosphate isomerase-like protein (cupin superfamily)